MALGITQVDLNKSKSGFYYNRTQEMIGKYLLGDHSLETINVLIKELIYDELPFFAEEEFPYKELTRCNYTIIIESTFNKLKENKILSSELNYSSNMYVNFKYENNAFIHPEAEKNYLHSNMPCLVYFQNNIVTFFILDEDGDAYFSYSLSYDDLK